MTYSKYGKYASNPVPPTTTHASQFNRALVRLTDLQSKRRSSTPLPEVTSNLANSTWEADSPAVVFQDEPSPISEQQNESEIEAA
ncbi:MAG: hypothetical protein HY820_39080 [Acidobacteria bacterium]|nr:hypothetical protein [Acidobacteriota bacterium]